MGNTKGEWQAGSSIYLNLEYEGILGVQPVEGGMKARY